MANEDRSRQLMIEAVIDDNNEVLKWNIFLGVENRKLIASWYTLDAATAFVTGVCFESGATDPNGEAMAAKGLALHDFLFRSGKKKYDGIVH